MLSQAVERVTFVWMSRADNEERFHFLFDFDRCCANPNYLQRPRPLKSPTGLSL